MAKTSCKKGQYYCNTDKKCKPIPRGFTVREDGFLVREGWSAKYKKSIDCNNPKGFSQKAHCAGKKKKMTEESNPRIARKKGQPAKSKKHSDLYTDEDPKGTIHGLGFKDVATAKASVAKIRKSGRSHAHKIQAAIAMEQRARVMGKTSEAAVYRKFINSMKKKTKAMNEEKHGDHEYEMIRRQVDNIMVNAKKLKKKVGKGEGEAKAWVQSKITKAADYLDTAADYMTDKESVKEGTLRSWFKGSKSKDGKGGWVNVKTGGTCASDEPGEGVPKCVSRAKYDSMSKKERESAHRRKRAADPNQQSKTGAAKPTYVSTDKPKKKKKKTMKDETEFTSLPLVLEVPQSDGEFKLGLMFRESLEQDRGMLFIFESDDYWTFHMKNTFIPLDIAFIKEDGTIDSIKELDPMSPVPVYPDSEIRYAVEVNRGWFAENGVEVGDRILEEAEEINEVKDKKGKGSGTKDACYYKVKSRYSVWPSAYASGALVKCRKVGAANWGNSRKEEVEYEIAESMPSNPSYKGVGATKKSNPFPQGKQKVRVFKEPQRMFVKGDGKVLGSDLTPKEYSKKNFPSAETTKKELKKTYDKEVPYYDSRGSDTLTQLGGKEGKFIKIDSDLKTFHNKRVVATAGKGSKDKDKYSNLDYSKGSKLANIRKKEVNMKDHYNWRDSFDLDEQALNMAQRRAARGSSYKAPTPKPQPKPAPTPKPVVQAKPAAPAPQAKPAAPAPKMGRTEVANRQKLGNERVDALKAKNAQFQAAKKSGNLAQFRKDNPKLSGRERAQQMAKARIAAKNAPAAKPTANTVSKPAPQQAQARQSAPAPQAKPTPQVKTQGGQGGKQLGSTTVKGGTVTRTGADAASAAAKVGGTQNIPASQKVTPTSSTSGPGKGSIKFQKGALSKLVSGDKPTANTVTKPQSSVPAGSFGISAKGKEQADANKAEVASKNIKNMPGSGKPIPKGADVTQKTTTNDQGQKVTRTTVKTSGSSTDGFAGEPDKQAQLIDVKNKRRARQGLVPLPGGTNSANNNKKPTGDTSKIIGMDQKTGEKKLQNMKQKNKPFDDFDAEIEKLEAETPLVNSKGQKVKKIPGTNSVSGGTKKQMNSMNQNMANF